MSNIINSANVEALDPTFGSDESGVSWLKYPDGTNGFVWGITVAPDNKLLIAGRAGKRFSIVRLKTDGRQDPDFGDQGSVIGAFAVGDLSTGRSVRVLKDKTILLEGWFDYDPSSPSLRGLALFDDKGMPVKAFGNDGVLIVDPISTPAYRLSKEEIANKDASASREGEQSIELPDGKLMIISNHLYSFSDNIGLLIRLEKNGSLDMDFHGKGYVAVQYLANYTTANSLIRLQDRSFAVGGSTAVNGKTMPMIARFNAQGEIISEFGNKGFVVIETDQHRGDTSQLIELPDGNILGIGSTSSHGIQSGLLFCIDNKGALVSSFNQGEPLITAYPRAPMGIQWLQGTLRQGKHIMVIANTLGEEDSKTIVAKFDLDGVQDSNFADKGFLTINLTDVLDFGVSIAIQNDQIIGAGTSLPHADGVRGFAFRCSELI
ncbi:hypothetical protein [Pseudomonas fluorescens]|uniref:Delta-60 repeat domain-containing protein n=1 Tax=Pseudomonas fluorescens TaxID=294 RepID=A0A5E6WT82_PSEFL|nr:hypothetical protein [Pseudomonas fluorescens]VVN31976.1 hypothetical protein PS655_04920 [Pseudomonas fluorescens]